MNDYLKHDSFRLLSLIAIFIIALILVLIIHRFFFLVLRKKVSKSSSNLNGYALDLFKVPSLWFIYWILLKVFSHLFLREQSFFPFLMHISNLLLIYSVAWILVQFVKTGAFYLQSKLDIGVANNLSARRNLTQIKVFKAIANSVIVLVAIAMGLMTFDQAKTIGLSLLTSAGIVGIIVGFAAQKSIGMILAGVQLAVTQPISLDDVVIVEGEWGRIEEITLTFVVVKIWDERRLILPVNYFLEKPFQNWTRTNADITGTIFLNVDYSFPVESIRSELSDILKKNTDWDGRVMNVQVTKATEHYKEIRILLSSSDAPKNWNLRTKVREQLIDFINLRYPGSFAKLRLKQD